jgi:hypothetical protein
MLHAGPHVVYVAPAWFASYVYAFDSRDGLASLFILGLFPIVALTWLLWRLMGGPAETWDAQDRP